jgi:hypothetical protein
VAVAAFTVLSGCGYHVSGHADLLPANIKTIAIPAFGNVTTRYRLTDRIPAALTHEFITRTRYRIVQDVNEADAVLRGGVMNYGASPNVVDQVTGRSAAVQITATVQVAMYERATGKVLFNRPYMELRQRYEISSDQLQYFEESETALDRVSRDLARNVVSAILEAF